MPSSQAVKPWDSHWLQSALHRQKEDTDLKWLFSGNYCSL